jgi:hypothetical protein
MFGKFLSVANDGDTILEESDNSSYVRDNRCDSQQKG